MIGSKEILSIGEVALLTGVSEKTVRGAIKRGDLVAYRFNARVVTVSQKSLQAWLDHCLRMARMSVSRKMAGDGTGRMAGTGTTSAKRKLSA